MVGGQCAEGEEAVKIESLTEESLRPLCKDHRPVADGSPEEGVTVSCPNCGFCMLVSWETFLELQ